MTDADTRFLERLEIDLAQRLGPRVAITRVSLDRPAADRVRILVSTETESGPGSFSEEGDSLTAVAAALLHQCAEVRLAEGFREVLDGASA